MNLTSGQVPCRLTGQGFFKNGGEKLDTSPSLLRRPSSVIHVRMCPPALPPDGFLTVPLTHVSVRTSCSFREKPAWGEDYGVEGMRGTMVPCAPRDARPGRRAGSRGPRASSGLGPPQSCCSSLGGRQKNPPEEREKQTVPRPFQGQPANTVQNGMFLPPTPTHC